MSDRKVSIVIADAQILYREGVKSLLAQYPELKIDGEAGNTQELILVLKKAKPDILILDFNPKYFNAEVLRDTLLQLKNCKVIIISSQDKKWNIFKSLEFNVYCYLTKECGKKDIYAAIKSTAMGEKFFCSFIVEVLLGEKRDQENQREMVPSCLTEREKEITALVAKGMMNKEIAVALHVSPHTIHTHRKNVMKKLGLHSALELANYAKGVGLID